MRYIFFLLLLLYIPASESETMPTRFKRRRKQPHGGVRGRNVRRLNSGNIFNMRDPYLDPFAGEPRYSGVMELAFEARMMLAPKLPAQPTGKVGSIDVGHEPILDLPPKTLTITKMGMQQMMLGYSSSASAENFVSADSISVLEPPPYVDSTTNSSKSSTPLKSKGQSDVSMKSKLSKKTKTSMSAMGKGMGMNKVTEKPKPTHSPTLMPLLPHTPQPGQSPTLPTLPLEPMSCFVDEAGNVGISRGDTTLYDFFYQLEVAPGFTAQQVDDNLLGGVEVAMVNAIIPGLFPQQCGRRQLQESTASTMESRYVGLSSNPPDLVLDSSMYYIAQNTYSVASAADNLPSLSLLKQFLVVAITWIRATSSAVH
jgi:hypothetical protein